MTLQIISITAKLRDDLLLTLKHDSEKAVLCFTENQMIVNPHNFQAQFYKSLKREDIMNQLSLKLKMAKLKQLTQQNIDNINDFNITII